MLIEVEARFLILNVLNSLIHESVSPAATTKSSHYSSVSLSCSLSLWLNVTLNDPSLPCFKPLSIQKSEMSYFPPLSALVLCHSVPCVYGNIRVIGDRLSAAAPHFLLFIWPHASARRTDGN